VFYTGASILRNADCGMRKVVRGNLRKIKCRTFRKLPRIAFPHSAAEKFRISADCKTAVRSRCTTDVQPMHSSVRRPAVLSSRRPILCSPFAKNRVVVLQFRLTSKSLSHSKCHVISLVDVIGFNWYNRCNSLTDNRRKPIMFNSCDTGQNRCRMTATVTVAVATDCRDDRIV